MTRLFSRDRAPQAALTSANALSQRATASQQTEGVDQVPAITRVIVSEAICRAAEFISEPLDFFIKIGVCGFPDAVA
jgi:capsule polysaccharide export protein KpsC/LpsZ